MAEAYVHTGAWINHSKGPILGATLTITPRNGSLLIAFLALYVRMAGSQLWSLICFVLHQVRSTREPRDGLYHQQQILLRNSSSQNATLLELLKVSWFWKSHAKGGIWRSIPLIILAVTHTVTFALAGLFSSRVATTSDEVLVRSPYCGTFKFPDVDLADYNETSWDSANANEMTRRARAILSTTYSRQCYVDSSTTGCDIFVKQQIKSNIDRTVSCPFAEGVCPHPNEGVVRIDSGPVYSDTDLGINTHRRDSLIYRRAMTCAPLDPDMFSELKNGTREDLPGDQFQYYYWGGLLNETGYSHNYTYVYDYYSGQTRLEAYQIDVEQGILDYPSDGTFYPRDQLNTTDSDVNLIFLEDFAQYTRPVTDLWFHADKQVNSTIGVGKHLYIQSWPVSVLACTEQHQFCNPNLPPKGGCSPLTGISVLGAFPLTNIRLNYRQQAVASRIFQTLQSNVLWSYLVELGTSALQAENYLDTGSTTVSALLPSDEWIIEVNGWQSAILANIQREILDYAQGPASKQYNSDKFIQPPNAEDVWMCNNQKRSGTAYYNFSIIGLLVILVVGGAILVVNQTLSTIVGFVQRVLGKGLSHRQEWRLNYNLQLQRMAYEGARVGTWEGKDRLVPVTAYGEKFVLPSDAAPAYSPYEPYDHMIQQQYNPLMKNHVDITVRNMS